MKVLLFLGAGASVELGIPAMRAMAQELHSHLASQRLSQTVLARFEALLSDADYDIEHLIETIDGIVDGATQRTKLGLCVADDLDAVAPIMSREAEWYIQHVCEQLREGDARVLWSAALRKTAGHELCLATTNYDRSIEIGCRFNDVVIDDGFELFGDGREFARWKGVDSGSPLQLLKMHGSTDWYRGEDGHIYKLSHPMPLYGNLAVVDNENHWPKMTSALVLPTREKRVNHPPYPDLVTSLRNAASRAEIAIFLGTSLRDPDIADMCRQCAARIPTYFVSKDGAPADGVANLGAKVVVQMASKFIASTLPKFLTTSRATVLEEAGPADGDQASILQWLTTIQDISRTPKEICGAIEKLADNEIALDTATLRPLLAHEDRTVGSYAIALVDRSLDRAEAMKLAEERANAEPEGSLATELTMLKTLIENGDVSATLETSSRGA